MEGGEKDEVAKDGRNVCFLRYIRLQRSLNFSHQASITIVVVR